MKTAKISEQFYIPNQHFIILSNLLSNSNQLQFIQNILTN